MAVPLAQLLAELIDPERQINRAERVDRLAALLIREGGIAAPNPRFAGDGRLNRFAARKIAAGVVDGWIDWHEDVERLLSLGAAKALQDSAKTPAPWVYLIGTMPKLFAERERCWSASRKPR